MHFRRDALCWLLLLSLGSMIAPAKSKRPLEWLTGTLIDVSSERGNGFINGISFRIDVTYYTVDDGQQYVYVFKRKLTHENDKELIVTVNAPIKFAISGKEYWIMDDQGNAHKLSLQKRALRPTNGGK